MAYVSVDVDISDFSDSDLVAYVAEDDARWARAIAARERVLEKRGAPAPTVEAAIADGLIAERAP